MIPISEADKEKVAAFQKEMISLENLTDKGMKLAGTEILKVIKGDEPSVDLTGLAKKAGDECLRAGESLAKKSISDTLPLEVKMNLKEGKDGLISGYKLYAESFTAIDSFIKEKKPLTLVEYKRKSAQAKELITASNEKIMKTLESVGIMKP